MRIVGGLAELARFQRLETRSDVQKRKFARPDVGRSLLGRHPSVRGSSDFPRNSFANLRRTKVGSVKTRLFFVQRKTAEKDVLILPRSTVSACVEFRFRSLNKHQYSDHTDKTSPPMFFRCRKHAAWIRHNMVDLVASIVTNPLRPHSS